MKTPEEEQTGTVQCAIETGTQALSEAGHHAPPSLHPDLQDALVQALCDGEGLDGLSSRLAAYMNGCVVAWDSNGSPLSIQFPGEITAEQKKLLKQYVAVQNGQRCRQTGEKLSSPVVFTDTIEDDTVYCMTILLAFGCDRSGSLSVIGLTAPFSQAGVQTFTHAASLFCVQLAQDKKFADIELRLKGNFVEDLISSHYADPESILNRARALDYNIQAAHRVLVAQIDNHQHIVSHLGSTQTAEADFKTELVQSLQSCVAKTHNGMVTYSKDNLIFLVQPSKASDKISDFNTLADRIIEDAASKFKAKLFIGIGSTVTALSDFSKSYMEAKKALDIGEYMITEGQVRSFEQFKVHALFLSTLKPGELYNYARDQLGNLLVYDEKHQTDFLKTLQEFLYLRNNVEGTAKTLNMSVSGLKYRLQKIEKILGHNLKDYKVCFDLQLALVILQLFGEYRIKEST